MVDRRGPELSQRLHPDRSYLAVWAIEYEQARTADDVLARRTRITLEVDDVTPAAARVEKLLDGDVTAAAV